MFAQHTIEAIIALACIDTGVTESEKNKLQFLLHNGSTSAKIVRFKEAAKMLNLTQPTVRRMAASGILQGVKTGGVRSNGVTEQSIHDFINSQKK